MAGQQQEAIAAMMRLQLLSRQRAAGRSLTEDEIKDLEESDAKCSHCGGYHVRACPRVRKIEFHQNGLIASVEFWPYGEVDWSHVAFEDQGPDDETLGLIEDAMLLAQWMGDRRGQPEYIVQAKRRVIAAYEAERGSLILAEAHSRVARLQSQDEKAAPSP